MATSEAASRSECQAVLTRLLDALFSERPSALATGLIAEFGSLGAILAASPERLAKVCGEDLSAKLRAVRDALVHSARSELSDRPLLGSSTAVIDYLRLTLAHLRTEHLLVLFLDARNRLIRDQIMFNGTSTGTNCSAREIVIRALELEAQAIIIAHNHPSGDPSPSKHDLSATTRLIEALGGFDIDLIDHIIVGRSGFCSLRTAGHLDAAERVS